MSDEQAIGAVVDEFYAMMESPRPYGPVLRAWRGGSDETNSTSL